MGEVPSNYRCHKCHKPGHWIKNCPMNPPGGKEHHHYKSRPESKKMTGIPRSLRDNIGSENQEPQQNQFIEEKREIPDDLICAICKGIFKDAVMIPCCGSSFCDDCVRTALLESEENECPDCKEKGTSPGSLIPNRFLRNAVVAFHAESSNVLMRDNPRSEHPPHHQLAPTSKTFVFVLEMLEEVAAHDDFEEAPAAEDGPAEVDSRKGCEESPNFDFAEELPEKDEQDVGNPIPHEKESESEDDDDNITVTVPPAHQQSRGATFRDSRMRRMPSHSVGDFHESFSHSATPKSHPDEGEDDSSDHYAQRQHSGGLKRNHSYDHPPQGISTLLGDDKGNSQNIYHSSGSSHSSNPNMSHGDSQNMYQQPQQPPPPIYQGQQQHSAMMPQMHSHSMYPQAPYHQQYFPPNQIR